MLDIIGVIYGKKIDKLDIDEHTHEMEKIPLICRKINEIIDVINPPGSKDLYIDKKGDNV